MKKIATTIAAIILVIFFIMSCEKDKYHRDRYIGDWDFITEVITQEYDDSEWKIVNRDTVYYSGTIAYGSSEDQLRIQYVEKESFLNNVKIDVDGNIYTLYWKDSYCKSGKFEREDQVHFCINWSAPYIIDEVVGTKRKEGNNE